MADLARVAPLGRILVPDRVELTDALLEGRRVHLDDDVVVLEAPGPAASEQGAQRVVAGGPEELELGQLRAEEAVVDLHLAAPPVAVRDPRRDEDHGAGLDRLLALPADVEPAPAEHERHLVERVVVGMDHGQMLDQPESDHATRRDQRLRIGGRVGTRIPWLHVPKVAFGAPWFHPFGHPQDCATSRQPLPTSISGASLSSGRRRPAGDDPARRWRSIDGSPAIIEVPRMTDALASLDPRSPATHSRASAGRPSPGSSTRMVESASET